MVVAIEALRYLDGPVLPQEHQTGTDVFNPTVEDLDVMMLLKETGVPTSPTIRATNIAAVTKRLH